MARDRVRPFAINIIYLICVYLSILNFQACRSIDNVCVCVAGVCLGERVQTGILFIFGTGGVLKIAYIHLSVFFLLFFILCCVKLNQPN